MYLYGLQELIYSIDKVQKEKILLTFMFTADFLSNGQKLKSKQSCITPRYTYAKLTWEFLSMYILHTTKAR